MPQKEWQSFILWRYLFWRENLLSSIVWVILSAVMFISKKSWFQLCVLWRYYNYFYRTLADRHYFKDTVHFYDVKICSHPVLPTHFFSAHFKTPVKSSYQNSYFFRAASIILKWEQPLEAVSSLQKDFFQNI